MVHGAGADAAVSLKRLHLFTHPSLLYGVIDKTRPVSWTAVCNVLDSLTAPSPPRPSRGSARFNSSS